MSDSFERIILSRFFKFKVGENEVPISVHEQAFADQSPALRILMQGKMSESVASEASWKDVDEGTFVRFTQFAYTGDYSIPEMFVKPRETVPQGNSQDEVVPVPDAVEPEAEEKLVDDDVSAVWTGLNQKKKKKSSNESRSLAFRLLSYPLLRSRMNFEGTVDPRVCEGPTENINEAILVHARLYVLAEKWGVGSLKQLTLFKLHQTLSSYLFLNLEVPKVCHVIKLARYAYSDENTPDLVNGIEDLRTLISKYVAADARTMSKGPEFIEMLEEGGAFVRDVWKCIF